MDVAHILPNKNLNLNKKKEQIISFIKIYWLYLLYGVLILVLGTILITFILPKIRSSSKEKEKTVNSEVVTASPTPRGTPKPIPGGSQEFNWSHSKSILGPKPTKVTISPLNPARNETATISVEVNSTSPVSSAYLTIHTDNDLKKITLRPSSNNPSTWTASYSISDSYDYRYIFEFTLTNSNNTFNDQITIRNAI